MDRAEFKDVGPERVADTRKPRAKLEVGLEAEAHLRYDDASVLSNHLMRPALGATRRLAG